MFFYVGATNNTLGGTTAGARNIISGTRSGFGSGAVTLHGGATGNMVEGNYIGTDVTGEAALGNGDDVWGSGVWISQASNNTISENVISASLVGVMINSNGEANSLTSGNVVQGNLIGTDASGTQVLSHASCGVDIGSGQGTQVTGNVIAGTTLGPCVFLANGSYGTMVQGNHIGTDFTNTLALGNQFDGIFVRDSSGNTISGNTISHSGADGIALNQTGGLTSNNAINDNTITANAGNGVAVYAGTGNSILGNSIHDNGGLGIYLNSANNANDNQAAAVLTSGSSSSSSTTVSGTLASVANTTFRIEFFSNADLDTSGNGEGLTYLGYTTVMTDSNGNATFTATNLSPIPPGQGYLTATVTNQSTGDTSEFSNYLAAPTSTVLTSSANPALLNQSVTFTATVSSSFGTPTGSVEFVDTTTGSNLGTVALSSNGTVSITVSNLALGSHVIEATYSSQGFFLGSSGTLTQQVSYKFNGFLPPLSSGLTFAVNRTIPIKFTLSDANGNAITSLSTVTSFQIFNSQGVDVLGGNGVAGLSISGNTYSYNWQTKGQPPGSYTISVKLADGTMQTKTIQLTAGGSSAGLVTDGSGGTATAGALLGGEVDLYVDNGNGDLTSDELARINDAVTSIDATIAPYGVAIVEVSDPTQANVTLSMNTTSSLGGFAQGVLGCTTDADQVTMIQGWNWYAGSDPSQVGAGQYDFETAVMHELGHVLGLGHSSDSASVMYATLAPGTANRNLVSADFNVPDDDSGLCALHAVPIAAVNSPGHGRNITASSGASVPNSGVPMSVTDQLFADLALLLSNAMASYASGLSSGAAMWQQADALVLQRLAALLSLEVGAMGLSKGILMRELLVAG